MRHQPLTPLVAAAHGSRDPRAAATVERLLDRVRATGIPVVTAFLDHAPPSVGQALGRVPAGPVVVLPLLLTAAYHSKVDIPAALAEARRPGVRYGDTLGPHPLLTAVLQRRLAERGVRPGTGTAVVLAAAGSSDPAANATIASMARHWRSSGHWGTVVPAYASAARPTPAEAVRDLRASGFSRVAVASYFLAPGYFADKVRWEACEAGATEVAPVLGSAPELAVIVAQRYREALASPGGMCRRPPIRLGRAESIIDRPLVDHAESHAHTGLPANWTNRQ